MSLWSKRPYRTKRHWTARAGARERLQRVLCTSHRQDKAVILSLACTSSSVAGALVGRVKRVREIFPIRKAYYLLQSGFLAANIT